MCGIRYGTNMQGRSEERKGKYVNIYVTDSFDVLYTYMWNE